ncbi:MAG TPA: prenyltransferase/squalene oxidase repeat-containing protein, partial [Solirubrobacterales bacterium]|nr:prenyltransferase/squalene oxidase repeat-containing protein [Solirubrobacterales bacterium]
MSWQAVSFLILGAVLLGGFAWYERSRPSSQVVALVAALAALAIAGRIAFAALPNVKPTTDVAIFAGYALGPAPGFAVGALAGLISNFWFGQGPWTPWQMAAWGACGVLGAALALRRRRPPGRLLLAAVCGLAGVGFGALMNFYEMSYGGDLSLQRFMALESRAVPFDAAHAIGNATLALVAGPAMVRMLVRFRARFEWRASTATATLLLALTLGLAALAPARAQAASETGRAAGWLVAAQNSDGGWGDTPARGSNAATTCWAMLGLEAAGRNPLDVALGATTPVDYLRANLNEIRTSGDFARTILALEGAGVDPRSFGGHNLVAALLNRRRRDDSFEGWPVTTAFAVLALRQAGATGGLSRSVSWLISVQNGDGGWGDTPGSPSTADDTGAAMEAIPSTQAARRGLSYLRSIQRPSGGFAAGSGPVNAQSTAWAAQGMLAAGADSGSAAVHDALAYLAARQASDGHFRYSSSSDQTPVWVTGEALAAAAAAPFPIEPPPRAPGSAPHPVTPAANGHAPAGSKPPGSSSNGSPANEVVPYTPAPGGSPSSEDLLKSLRKGAGGPAGAPGYPKPPAP